MCTCGSVMHMHHVHACADCLQFLQDRSRIDMHVCIRYVHMSSPGNETETEYKRRMLHADMCGSVVALQLSGGL